MSETGIKALDDICDSEECSAQSREACGKTHPCGHPCYGYIREKNCLPCLSEKCAVAKSE
jgi:RCR-type E3 ubiquitin transferase